MSNVLKVVPIRNTTDTYMLSEFRHKEKALKTHNFSEKTEKKLKREKNSNFCMFSNIFEC
jgi:hypothetical protein